MHKAYPRQVILVSCRGNVEDSAGKKVVKELLEPLKEGKDISFPQVVFEDGVVHSPRKGGNPEFPGIGACFMMTKKAVVLQKEH